MWGHRTARRTTTTTVATVANVRVGMRVDVSVGVGRRDGWKEEEERRIRHGLVSIFFSIICHLSERVSMGLSGRVCMGWLSERVRMGLSVRALCHLHDLLFNIGQLGQVVDTKRQSSERCVQHRGKAMLFCRV